MLTALRAYASAAVLCAHCVARIRTAIRCDLDRLRLSLRNYANGIIISRSTIPTEPRWSFRRVSPGNTGVNEPPFQKSPAPTGMGAFHPRPINNARVACVFPLAQSIAPARGRLFLLAIYGEGARGLYPLFQLSR